MGCVVCDGCFWVGTAARQQGRAGRAATDPADYGRQENVSPNGAGPSGVPFDPQATLPAFYELVSSIKEQLNNVDEQKMEMMGLHDVAKKLTKTPELQQAQKDMATLVMSIKKNLSDADKGIKAVQKSNEHDFVELVRGGCFDAAVVHHHIHRLMPSTWMPLRRRLRSRRRR